MEIALSPREREVADLVAQGLSNRQIAERLVISERTAEGHVEQIRNKLGFHSRAQVAAWVAARAGAPESPRVAARPSEQLLVAGAALATTVERPFLLVRLPRLSRAAAAIAFAALLVITSAVALWPRSAPATLVVVAGIGSGGYSGDNGPAIAAQLDEPTSIVLDRYGGLIFADSYRESENPLSTSVAGTHLRRIDPTGLIRTIVGDANPRTRFSEAEFGQQLGLPLQARIALGPDYAIYVSAANSISDPTDAHWVGRIDEQNGRFTWFAGGAPCCGAAILRTALFVPAGIAVGSDGVVYVSNTGTSTIVAIPQRGEATIFAGTGMRGSAGDGGPATSATFSAPPSIRLSSDGRLHIADANNHRVRAIDHGGRVFTVAGSGEQGFSGDGGPATLARLSLPADIAFAADGVIYIADSGNARVRAVARDGTISTVAGPEGLVRPTTLVVDSDGTVYIGDGGAHRIFKLMRPGR